MRVPAQPGGALPGPPGPDTLEQQCGPRDPALLRCLVAARGGCVHPLQCPASLVWNPAGPWLLGLSSTSGCDTGGRVASSLLLPPFLSLCTNTCAATVSPDCKAHAALRPSSMIRRGAGLEGSGYWRPARGRQQATRPAPAAQGGRAPWGGEEALLRPGRLSGGLSARRLVTGRDVSGGGRALLPSPAQDPVVATPCWACSSPALPRSAHNPPRVPWILTSMATHPSPPAPGRLLRPGLPRPRRAAFFPG